MRFNPNEIVSVLQHEITEVRGKLEAQEVGRVLEVGDGIARVYGLATVMAGEMVEFTRTKVRGLAFNLEENSVSIIILGEYLEIAEGDEVRTTGELLQVPVGEAMIGRVVNPLGVPLDGKGPIQATHFRAVESIAPGVAGRQPVEVPMQTGIKAIDAMTPIGRGQRELIIGDRKTGKTAIAIDAIVNQKGGDMICVYVAIGQKESTVAKVVEGLRDSGAMDYTIVVVSGAAEAAPLNTSPPTPAARWPSSSCTNRAAIRSSSTTTLSKQAAAYRQLSLLVRRPPGREAYPGDIFYAHSRLLRALGQASGALGDRAAGDGRQAGADDWGVNNEQGEKRQPGEKGKVYVGPADKEHAVKHDLAKFPGCKVAKVPELGRFADGVADHRDAGRRSVGVHPDERDFDHGRPDLLAAGPGPRRHLAGDGRRHLGVARRRQGPDSGDEVYRGRLKARLGELPRTGSVCPARHGTRQGDAGPARPRLSHGGIAQAAAVQADERDRSGHGDLRRHQGIHRQGAGEGSADVGRSVPPLHAHGAGGRAQRPGQDEEVHAGHREAVGRGDQRLPVARCAAGRGGGKRRSRTVRRRKKEAVKAAHH